jgi:hypothetical protein
MSLPLRFVLNVGYRAYINICVILVLRDQSSFNLNHDDRLLL